MERYALYRPERNRGSAQGDFCQAEAWGRRRTESMKLRADAERDGLQNVGGKIHQGEAALLRQFDTR